MNVTGPTGAGLGQDGGRCTGQMIDIHSHILPAVDDGSRSIQESIALLRVAVRDGIQEMVLTPHIFVGRWDNNLTMLRPRFEAFRRDFRARHLKSDA